MQALNIQPDAVKDSLLPVGRITFLPARGVLMDWSACGFSFRCDTEYLRFDFEPFSDEQPVSVAVLLDGVKTYYMIGDSVRTVTLTCSAGVHTVTLLRLSEGGIPLICSGICLRNRIYGEPPCLLSRPAPKKNRIVFLGDSITCGYSVLGDPDVNCFNTYEEDPTEGYACRCAGLLGADYELVSISGQGIVRCCDGTLGIPIPTFAFWQSRSLMTPLTVTGQPACVVINAGTNDAGPGIPDEEIYEGLVSLIRRLHGIYPAAELVLFYGLMGLRYEETQRRVAADLSDELQGKLHYLSASPICPEKGTLGGAGHPSAEADEAAAALLAASLRKWLDR